MKDLTQFYKVLQQQQSTFSSVLPFSLRDEDIMVIDLSVNKDNPLAEIDLQDTALLTGLLFQQLQAANARAAVGGYLEHRTIYARSQNFDNEGEPRRIHLGIDVWTKAHTPVIAPLPATIHSFQNNAGFGNYGPTIILEHHIAPYTFYTLYGHLSMASLEGKIEGTTIAQGEAFATIGNYPENGDWPPHLHFQLITDLLGQKGDFIGVCAVSQVAYYQKICPDPNLILGIPQLPINLP
ncbi:MAG: peptidoglycan DD-metalloendopeptidase family protein [Thermonemataceae bacterium]